MALAATILVCLPGCLSDANHENPLDPEAPDFVDEGYIEGRIVDRSLAGISGATITLQPGAISVLSSSDGTYAVAGVPAGQYSVTATGDEYAPAVDTVSVSITAPGRADFELNGLPTLDSWTVNTAHISRWWPLEDLFQMEITVQANDQDGVFDLGSVWLEIPSLNFSDTMQVTQTPGRFIRTLEETELPASTIHALLGTQMQLHVRDQLGAEATSPVMQLVRVVDEVPEATDAAYQSGSPNCLQVQSGNIAAPLVEWKEVFLPYPFALQVEVIRVDAGLESLVERIPGIAAESTSVSVSPVPPGDYYWTVAVKDNFDNRSRSKPVGFCVTQ